MTTPDAASLRDYADHLCQLAGTFQLEGNELRAQAIRRAERNLVSLEAVFDQDLAERLKHWVKANHALGVLTERLAQVRIIEADLHAISEERAYFELKFKKWSTLSEHDKTRIVQQVRLARHYIDNKVYQSEAHILHRYERYRRLKSLSAYADNADHLCEAIFHFENRLKYEESLVKLQQKRDLAEIRLKSVQRGFYLALALCGLLVTIPLCAPFAYSIWLRLREIQKQMANIDEMTRREERRLEAADEGVIAVQEIRDTLGNVPLDVVRHTLTELKELRSEFQRPEKTSSVTPGIVHFFELYTVLLEGVFGPQPDAPLECCEWIVQKYDAVEETETKVQSFIEGETRLKARLMHLTRGHSADTLAESIASLTQHVGVFPVPNTPSSIQAELADLCVGLPRVLNETRTSLGYISHGHRVTPECWQRLGVTLHSASNLMSCLVLECELAAREWALVSQAGAQLIPTSAPGAPQ